MARLTCSTFLFLILFSNQLHADTETLDTIDSPGVYLTTKSGYVKVAPYEHDYRFVDFNYANEVPYALRDENRLSLVIYEKDFHPNSVELELRPLDIKVNLQKLKFTVHTMKNPDMHELVVNQPISDGAMLQVRSWSHFDNFGVVMLGNTEQEFVKFFSQKDMQNAPIVSQYIADALVAFPDNPELKNLSTYWKTAAESEKDNRDYAYVDEKWKKYEEAEKLTLKERYLNALIVEINGYLNTHPEGAHSKEAQKRKEFAEGKLKEYEKLL